ncbi:MAG: hypothetical protein PF572_01510 [Patescibacteria group bacterium]|jgi:hypothetical protein|nr:hypothetical protein [Patescibacteria group bacterium]
MKKIVFIVLLLLIIPVCINAAQPNAGEARSRGFRVTPRNTEELNQAIEMRKQNFQKERAGMEEEKSLMYENQNKIRSGAQNLMIMENMIGKNGPETSRVAGDINLSSEKTLKLESEFKNRSKVKKFFFGHKKDIVDTFSEEISQRDKNISKLRELYEDLESSEEVKAIFLKQLENIEEEQGRIEEYFQNETKRKGILTWFANIFK